MFEQYDDILTAEEACDALRIGSNALYALLASGELKGFRNGRVWRIPKQSLIDYVLWGLGTKQKGGNETLQIKRR